MNDNRPSVGSSTAKTPIDDIIEHITNDLQSYGSEYILLGQRTETPSTTVWPHYDNQRDGANFVQNSFSYENGHDYNVDRNVYSQNSYTSMLNDNYVPYNMNPFPNEPSMNYMYYQQNRPSVSNEYGVFGEYQRPVLDNLVNNWTTASSSVGVYSPFGHSVVEPMDIDHTSPIIYQQSHHVIESQQNATTPCNSVNVVRKPRAVAEVKPMRPTYSDIVAKPVSSSGSNSTNLTINKNVSKIKSDGSGRPVTLVKTKKGTSGVKNNTNVVTLNRQHSADSGEHSQSTSKQNDKKLRASNGARWPSVEDFGKLDGSNEQIIEKTHTPRDVSSGKENKENKKSVKKTKFLRQTEVDEFELNNRKVVTQSQSESRKNVKKGVHINNNLQWGVSKQTAVQSEKKVDKSLINEGSITRKDDPSPSEKNSFNPAEDDTDGMGKSTGTGKVQSRFGTPTATQKKHRLAKRREVPSQFGLFWKRWSGISYAYVKLLVMWFINLVWDVIAMSFQLSFHMLGVTASCSLIWFSASKALLKKVFTNPWNWWRDFRYSKGSPKKKPLLNRLSNNTHGGVSTNIPLPLTGEEAMKRLLACKGKDAYSILGVTKNCSDETIKRYYKRQAVLVHPDKNNQPGAEEAFKILVHAFELIGETEKRKTYDRCILESHQVEKVWGEFNNLLSQLHKKMEYAANTIRCTNCGQRHRRIRLDRPLYASRFCAQCKIHHSSREGDIWAESILMGWVWKYYACMDGYVYDISDWASCQVENLRHLKPNTHVVQYRIVVGKHKTPSYPPQSPPPPPPPPPQSNRETDLDDFLNTIYGHSGTNCSNSPESNGRMRKKGKKKIK